MTRSRTDEPLSPDLGERERAYVFAIAMKYVKDEDAAEDVTQDALLSAFRHRHQFRGDSRYSTWLYRVAATAALMYLRKRRRLARELLFPTHMDDDESPGTVEFADSSPGPEETVAAAEVIDIVDRRLSRMGDKYRTIFWARFRDGYTEPEIARRMGLKLTTVKTRAYRARAQLRESVRPTLRVAA